MMTMTIGIRARHFLVAFMLCAGGAVAQTTQPADAPLDFGRENLAIPPAVVTNTHRPRTAELLGEAYQRREPVVWKRVGYISDLGKVALPGAAPYLAEAMKDPSPAVRAEAARSAALVDEAALLAEVEKRLEDADATVRREATLAAAKLARGGGGTTSAVERGLADKDPSVVAAALQSAWTPQHAALIAQKWAELPRSLQSESASALARLKATERASVIVPLLKGDTTQRVAALRALAALADASQVGGVIQLLSDAHPTVRREAVVAMGKLADAPTRHARAIEMLADADPTVRRAAAEVLTPLPSSDALAALSIQLDVPYAPLHEAVRAAMTRPGDDAVRQRTVRLAAEMLGHANPRRREDASYILGRLRSDAAIEKHIALLQWDAKDVGKTDWPLLAQAAESLGLIGHARAAAPLMTLIKPAPDALAGLQSPQREAMTRAMSSAMVSAARLRHRAALDEAVRILQTDPETCPSDLRASSAFAIGMLADPGGKAPQAGQMLELYESNFESRETKFEALKALGNLRHTPAAERLKKIAEVNPTTDLRWIAHWAYQRTTGTSVPYTPPSEVREPPVSISDVPR
jgi:HEAT repeat protein